MIIRGGWNDFITSVRYNTYITTDMLSLSYPNVRSRLQLAVDLRSAIYTVLYCWSSRNNLMQVKSYDLAADQTHWHNRELSALVSCWQCRGRCSFSFIPHPKSLSWADAVLKQPADVATAIQIIFIYFQQRFLSGLLCLLQVLLRVFLQQRIYGNFLTGEAGWVYGLGQVRTWRHMLPSGDSTERAVYELQWGLWHSFSLFYFHPYFNSLYFFYYYQVSFIVHLTLH